MTIIKNGNLKGVVFRATCEYCKCEFTATPGEVKRDTLFEFGLRRIGCGWACDCPECGYYTQMWIENASEK